ncbi:MAG: thioredoxin family protein [Patescibacteria group bacterium]
MKPVSLEVLHSPGCQICRAFDDFWQGIAKDWPDVTYKKLDVTTPEGQEMVQKHMIFSSPAIVLNGELFAMGGFDKEKFLIRLKELSES